MTIPTDRMYTRDHEWIRIDGTAAVVGITAYAAEALGDVVYVDLPEEASELIAGGPCGEIESTKSVSDLVAPATGRVTAVNAAVVDAPETVNADPYGAGWLYRLEIDEEGELLTPDEYRELTEGEGA